MKIAERIEKNLSRLMALLDDGLAQATQERSSVMHAKITNATTTASALVTDFDRLLASGLLDHADEVLHSRDGTTSNVSERPEMHASSASSEFAKRGVMRMIPRLGRALYPRG